MTPSVPTIPAEQAKEIRRLSHDLSNALEIIVQANYLLSEMCIRDSPISIDYQAFTDQSSSAPVLERVQQIKTRTHDIQIAVGVDRLDYTKGIPERLKACLLYTSRCV